MNLTNLINFFRVVFHPSSYVTNVKNVINVINNFKLDKGFRFTLQNKTHEVRLTNLINFTNLTNLINLTNF